MMMTTGNLLLIKEMRAAAGGLGKVQETEKQCHVGAGGRGRTRSGETEKQRHVGAGGRGHTRSGDLDEEGILLLCHTGCKCDALQIHLFFKILKFDTNFYNRNSAIRHFI